MPANDMVSSTKPVRRRPKDAAAILLIDRSGADKTVLVGRRSVRHAFMPDLYVFPGGRRDSADNRTPIGSDYHPTTEQLLLAAMGALAARRVRGLGVCALRELYEETGLVKGRSFSNPDLSILRYVARAITPPGSVRRYDTHFFACFIDELGVDREMMNDSSELSDLRFIDIAGDISIKMPEITKTVLADLHSIVSSEPSLPFGTSVPCYLMRNGRNVRDIVEESKS